MKKFIILSLVLGLIARANFNPASAVGLSEIKDVLKQFTSKWAPQLPVGQKMPLLKKE